MADALGIVTFTDPSIFVRGLSKYRGVAAFSFVGRYRLVDIPISNLANSGVEQLQVYTNNDAKVLFDHIGSARHYNINNKHGHVSIVPVQYDGNHPESISDMQAYNDNRDDIVDDPNEFVIITPVNFVYKANFADLLDAHIESGADVSVLYQPLAGDDLTEYLNAHALDITGKKNVRRIDKYIGGPEKTLNMSLGTYILSKKVFLKMMDFAAGYSPYMWMKDVINVLIEQNELEVQAIPYEYPVFPILSIKTYYDSNMAMLKESNMSFFNDPNWPIYTRTNDSPPAIYIGEGNAQSALISNGCQVEGEIHESILGRNVKIGKGAKVTNCIIMPGAVIGDGVFATGLIIDKDAHLINSKEVTAVSDTPYYVDRRETL